MVDMNALVPADSLPLDLSVPLCHPKHDKWGRVVTAHENGTVAVAWNDESRATTKPLGWFRRRPARQPRIVPEPPTPEIAAAKAAQVPAGEPGRAQVVTGRPVPQPPTFLSYVVKVDGEPFGVPKQTVREAAELASSQKRIAPRKEIRVEEVRSTVRTVAFIESRGRNVHVVPVNGGS